VHTTRPDNALVSRTLKTKRSFRRMRIGTQLVRWLEKVALTAGAFNLFVEVRSRNPGAMEFYESLGFLVLEEHKRATTLAADLSLF
jgi:ribosomal protein S18 acetylase RimI-like enzyme